MPLIYSEFIKGFFMPKKKLPKWVDVYPQGTKDGNDEQKLFVALERHKEYKWRTVAALAKEAGLTPLRVEQILDKYYKKGMVVQNPKSHEQWGYWERIKPDYPHLFETKSSVSITDKRKRLEQG